MAVTMPVALIVATLLLLLYHTPPLVGDNMVVYPIHKSCVGTLIIGLAITVTVLEGLEIQPVVLFVKVKVTVPAFTPTTYPALETVAIELLLLSHVPPVEGDNVVVEPTQIEEAPVIEAVGLVFTRTELDGFELHPVVLLV